MKKFYVLLLAALTLGITGGCGGKEDTPEDALVDIQTAIANQDRQLIDSRVDVDKFLDNLYSDVTVELADNVEQFHNAYPDDPYFWNTPQFIRKYNEEKRGFYMSFVNASVNAYFDPEMKADTFINLFAIQCAKEFKNICAAMDTKSSPAVIQGDHAFIDFEINGDDTPYGKFMGNLTFRFGFEKNEKGRWQLKKIENLNTIMPAIVDKAELVWPEYALYQK